MKPEMELLQRRTELINHFAAIGLMGNEELDFYSDLHAIDFQTYQEGFSSFFSQSDWFDYEELLAEEEVVMDLLYRTTDPKEFDTRFKKWKANRCNRNISSVSAVSSTRLVCGKQLHLPF